MYAMDTANQTFANCSYMHNAAVYGGSGHFKANSTAAFINTHVEHSRALASPKGDGATGGSIGAIDRAQVHRSPAVARCELASALQKGLELHDCALFI
jgi:hypothetical protein